MSHLVIRMLFCAVVASANPGDLKCPQSITTGQIHRKPIVRSSSRTLAFAGVTCGGTITAGTTQTLSLSNNGGDYAIEAVASAGPSAVWGLAGGTCSKQRRYNAVPSSYTVPPSGTVILRVAWAASESTVSTSEDCTYTVAPAIRESSEAVTSGAQLTAGRALVFVTVTLPMTQRKFKLQEGAFIEAMAAAAGALKEDVSIKSVREVASRRGGPARRAGTKKEEEEEEEEEETDGSGTKTEEKEVKETEGSGTSLQVSVEIKTKNTAAVMLSLTQNSLAAEMVKKGLPAPTSFAAEVRQEVAVPSATVEQMNTIQDQKIESKALTILIVASVVGVVLLVMRCACVYMSPCRQGSPKASVSAGFQETPTSPRSEVCFYSNRITGDIESTKPQPQPQQLSGRAAGSAQAMSYSGGGGADSRK